MVKFKDKTSGVIIEFTNKFDIDSMEGHPDYDRLDAEGRVVVPEANESKPLPFKAPTRGRPKKAK